MADTDDEPVNRDQLDQTIADYARDVLGHKGPVTGWVLCVSTMHFDDDGDARFGWDYVNGPQTDLVRSLGLLEVVRIDIGSVVSRAATPGEED